MNKILLIIAILISGCVARYQDISNTGYTQLLGTSYTTKEEMCITGVNLPPGYGKDINIYKIEPANPNWTGPEVITRDILEKGSKLTIESVKKCTNCFERTIIAIVTINQYEKEADVPVEINLKYIKPKYVNKS